MSDSKLTPSDLYTAALTWSIEEIQEAFGILRDVRSMRAKAKAYTFRPGDTVEFGVERKRSMRADRIRGEVVKRLRKNIKIRETHRRVNGEWQESPIKTEWRVGPTLLEKVS